MNKHRYILKLSYALKREQIGNKAQSLLHLKAKSCTVPETWVCISRAWEDYRSNPGATLEILREELGRIIPPDRKFAVRSSTSLEDSDQHSYAGQFHTDLEISGPEEVLKSILRIWSDAASAAEKPYSTGIAGKQPGLSVSVIIQEFIEPVLSGVAFSIDPVTGRKTVIIEAIRGRGDLYVQKGLTPLRWAFRHGKAEQAPEHDEYLILMKSLAETVGRLAGRPPRPVDIEWVYDGNRLYWLQMRAITRIERPEIFSNRISREFLPGIIKPLVWSVNIPLVNGAWIALLSQIAGRLDVQPEELSRSFHYRAYFNMGALGRILESFGFPADSLESLMFSGEPGKKKGTMKPNIRILRHTFRFSRFIYGLLIQESTLRRKLPGLESRIRAVTREKLAIIGEDELWDSYRELFRINREIASYNIIVPIINQLYHNILKRKIERLGLSYADLVFQTDTGHFRHALQTLQARFGELSPEEKARLKNLDYDRLPSMEGGLELKKDIDRFLERYGHFGESGNDFSIPAWHENPQLIFDMLRQEPAVAPEKSKGTDSGELKGHLRRRPMLRFIHGKAERYLVHKERISNLYTYGYGLFRTLFLRAGSLAAAKGLLEQAEDIFYLSLDEAMALFEPQNAGSWYYRDRIASRKTEIGQVRDLTLPTVIFGQEPPPPGLSESPDYKGIPASPGYYRGTCTVVRGYSDFEKVRNGDVVVVPFSDVGWTPVFIRAGAVIAESGGILSHASIVARELGIAAVVSVEQACRIPDGTRVTVDGFTGRLFLDSDHDPSP